MSVSRISCDMCNLHIEGPQHMPPLVRLAREDMALAEAFVLSGGNLKDLAQTLGITYPTLRKRLDAMIENLRAEIALDKQKVSQVLADIESGKIDPERGIHLLREINHDN
ncbi:hypothetical protein RA27_17950 [Ruegeria sp. ANG-R]|nr:hypothetical protein RA27_17950 [Ruegeria sp. ANG-R]